ncbi:ABC transporter ATP-binding protein [Erythrobacter donghaensis]|jgi:iron complex transport system ATP-binding protein|uniref:ABC transporter ATP-binding protein n=1 Tax=Erythrobacter donghaensis TaxID=267135 RepID=UPI0009BFBC50|nr:ABC transporter ATP-binding protein [Erythrobacter donghaensis]
MSALHFHGVSARRGQRLVLDGISAFVPSGHLTAVIGPNGAGKSTLLDIASGLKRPAQGSVELDGKDLHRLGRRELAKVRAYLPQRAGVDWPITVERVVALGLTPALPAFGSIPSALLPAIDDALLACDLLGLRDRPATQLSGGELARAMLARAIVGDPALLIVDEPTAGLDPRHAIDAVQRLKARTTAGCTVVMAIHDLDLALAFADSILAIRDGRLLAHGPTHEVVTESLLTSLYDVPVRLSRDGDGISVRFLKSGVSS